MNLCFPPKAIRPINAYHVSFSDSGYLSGERMLACLRTGDYRAMEYVPTKSYYQKNTDFFIPLFRPNQGNLSTFRLIMLPFGAIVTLH